MIGQSQCAGQVAQLAKIALQGDGVDLKVLRREAALTAEVNLDGASADDAADNLLELRFQQIVRFAGAETDFQIAIVDRTQFEGQMEIFVLIVRLAVAGHAAQHAHLLLKSEPRP